jgi:PAS domain S-box-containing protein
MKQSFRRPALMEREELQNAILDSLDVSLAALDEKGFIVGVSGSWTRFAEGHGGQQESTGVGTNYLDVCQRSTSTDPDAQRVLNGILSVMKGAAPKFIHEYWCDSPTEQDWFVMTVVPHPSIPGGAVLLHQKNSQITSSEARYGELLDSVRAILWRAQAPDFRTTFASRQIEDILGFALEAWTDDPLFWEKQLHPQDREWVLRYRAQEVAARRQHSFDYRILDLRGRTIWLRNKVTVIVENGEVKELVGVSTDMTERMEAIAERDRLGVRLLRSQDEERSAIARELHDDVGQSIAILGVKLQLLKGRMTADSYEASQLEEAHAFINKLAQDVQRISHGLHSSSLELLGLASAAAHHCREYALNRDVDVECDIGDIPRDLDRDISVCVFRVLQECLRNVAKHSKASRVTVKLSLESNQIQLKITDDGVGFDPAAEAAGPGLGLASMSERVRLLHGKFTIASSVGNGTQVTAVVPYRKTSKSGVEMSQR